VPETPSSASSAPVGQRRSDTQWFRLPKRPDAHDPVNLRKQLRKNSVARCRARLSQAIEDLWEFVPEPERQGVNTDSRKVCRAVKLEAAICYLKRLQTQQLSLRSGNWDYRKVDG
jgi:hypothetical protein